MKNVAFVVFIISAAAMDSEAMCIPAALCLASLLVLVWFSRKDGDYG